MEGAARMVPGAKSLHVRFMGVGEDKDGRFVSAGVPGGRKIVPGYLSVPYSGVPSGGSIIHPHHDLGPGGTTTESSESETENNHSVLEEETTTTKKFLLLIDQLSLDQKKHLSIKDIGVILERLSSKIIDVERLDRESEAVDCFHWTIKATLRGDFRELGVIYNGNFYSISEVPSFTESQEEQQQQDQPLPPPLPSHQTFSTASQTGSRNSSAPGNGAGGGGGNSHHHHHQPSTSHASRIDDDEDMKL